MASYSACWRRVVRLWREGHRSRRLHSQPRGRPTFEPGVTSRALEAYCGHVPPDSTLRTRTPFGSEVTLRSKSGDSGAARNAADGLISRPPGAGAVLPGSSTAGRRLAQFSESALARARGRLIHAALRLGDLRRRARGRVVTSFSEPIVRRGASSPRGGTGTFGSHGIVFAG